jgi:hypothetical protein
MVIPHISPYTQENKKRLTAAERDKRLYFASPGMNIVEALQGQQVVNS